MNVGDVPHPVHRALGGQSEADGTVEEEQAADHDGEGTPGQGVDL